MKAILRLISLILLLAFSLISAGEVSSYPYKNTAFKHVLSPNITHYSLTENPVDHPISSRLYLNNPLLPEPLSGGDSLVLFAGNDTTVCFSGFYVDVYGEAQNFYYTSWATTGDGFFAQATQLHTQYFPGPQDKANGIANIYLVGICVVPDYIRIVDSIQVSLIQTPSCFAGLDDFICEDDSYQIMAEAGSYAELNWSSTGDGSFDQTDILNPKYFHGTTDLANGQVTLELVASAMEPCILPDVNQMTLYIIKKPMVSAGNDTILCEGQMLQLNAEVSNGNGIFWTSDGDGSFSEITATDPVYNPGPMDIETGGCVLVVNVAPVYPCDPYPGDELLLEIVSHPDVSLGSDQTICEDGALVCESTVENYESLQWQVLGGNGFFEDSSQMNTIYHPGEHEKNTGVFFIMLIVNANDPCTSEISAYFKVDLVNQAVISVGADQLICSTDTANLYGVGENYESVFWQTNGDGTFLGDDQLSRKYFPGTGDKQNGFTEIFICATPVSPCEMVVCDTMQLLLQEPAEIFAGNDVTICQDVMLTGEVEHAELVYWVTTGDGTFENQTSIGTLYHAGPGDIEDRSVTVSLIAESLLPCEAIASDDIFITIDRPVLESENLSDQELLVGESANLSITVSSLQQLSYQWFHKGEVLSGQNSPELNLTECQHTDAGRYYCLFWNDCFTSASDTAMITVFAPSSQIITLTDGWNAVSSYVLPSSSEIEVVLLPIIDELVILYSNEGIFYPGQDVQTFSNWNANHGYILKTTTADNFTINGFIKYPSEEIILQPGWSLLPGAQSCAVTPEELFGSNPQIAAIKEVGGFRIYWPEKHIFTLENINPGKAYAVFNASDEVITLTFPGCDD